MLKIILIALLYSLIIIPGGGSASAQKPPQNTEPVTQTPAVAPQPEIPNQISTVIIENNHLSVEFVNVSFGEILQSIGKKAGFRVEGFNKVLSKKLTTRFTDLDIDSGIIRLFSLVKESNYLINYDTKGSISKLKIYNIGAVGSITPASSSTTETGAAPFSAWRSRRIRYTKQAGPPSAPPPDTPDK